MTAIIKCFMLFAFALVLLATQINSLPSRMKRQQGFNWNNEFNNNQRPTTAAPNAGTTTTTASPQYTACIRQCATTPEYNPVCGSNRITYDNESRLRCANRCGLRVTKVFAGTCSPL